MIPRTLLTFGLALSLAALPAAAGAEKHHRHGHGRRVGHSRSGHAPRHHHGHHGPAPRHTRPARYGYGGCGGWGGYGCGGCGADGLWVGLGVAGLVVGAAALAGAFEPPPPPVDAYAEGYLAGQADAQRQQAIEWEPPYYPTRP